MELRLEEEFGPFVDEVLGAGWLPQPDLAAGRAATPAPRQARIDPDVDTDAFLRTVYLSQE
ncbi:MAG TPA: hypothetical protein VEN78_34205 [Bradyrhizobium sp.]|nr:hypothetical protein [Bradyrhizobium sp.]